MTEISMHLSEITDSREVMESKPYPMVVYFIYLLLSILVISLTWMYFSEIDIVVKGTGIVRPNQGISIINNKVTGRIAETRLEEGLKVQKGDLLYTIMHDDLKATQELLSTELVKQEKTLENMKLYKESVMTKTNLFDAEDPDQREYYFKYIGFSEDLTGSKASIHSNQETLNRLLSQSEGMQTLKDSIDLEKSLFSDPKELYALKYSEYILKQQELHQIFTDAEEQYESSQILFENGAVSKSDYQASYTAYIQNQVAYEQYKASFMASLDNDIEETHLQIQKVKAELNSLSPGVYTNGNDYLPAETKTIINIDDQITTVDQDIRSIKENLTKTELEIEKCLIRAETDGVINIKRKIAVGDYIGAGDTIATVIPQENTEYTLQISMPEREISTIEVGDPIKYHFNALPYREYGELTGTVQKISVDSTINEETGANFFIIEADVENKPLYSYKGERADLKVGMTCEAQVITKSKKVFFFLLEKIDLWD